jgi:hypothetical protein
MFEKHKNYLAAAVTAVTAVRCYKTQNSSYCGSNSSDSSKIILMPQLQQ